MTKEERMQALQELRNPMSSVLKSITMLKGDRGPEGPMGPEGPAGYTPVKGEDYFTDEEISAIIKYIQSNVTNGKDGKNGINGAAPAKGIDYWTEKDQKKIIEEAIKQLPKPKDGISPDAKKIAADVVKQISIPDTSKHITQEQLIDFLRRGGFRGGGGGISGLTAVIHDATLTGDGTSTSPLSVVSSGGGSGGSIVFETPVGTIDGSNKTFTVTNTPQFIVMDSETYFNGQGYTLVGLTVTMDIAPIGFLQSAYASSGSVETPAGAINGINTSFTVTNIPTVIIIDNLTYFNGNGFSISGLTITTDIAPTGYIRSLYGNFIATPNNAQEVPNGLINSSNVTYTLVTAPKANTLTLSYQGQIQIPNVDYTLSGNTITFASPPDKGTRLFANYQY